MAIGRFGYLLPPRLSSYFLPMNIITEVHPRHRRDPKFPAGDSNAKQSHHHTAGLRSACGKSFSRSLVCIIDIGFEVCYILIFTVPGTICLVI